MQRKLLQLGANNKTFTGFNGVSVHTIDLKSFRHYLPELVFTTILQY